MSSEFNIPSGMAEQFVLGLCNAEEELQVAEWRAQYPAFNQAILDFEEQLANQFQQAATTADFAPEATAEWENLLQKIEPPVQLQTPVVPIAAAKTRRNFPAVAAAAIVLLLLSVAGNFMQYRRSQQQAADIAVLKSKAALPAPNNLAILMNPKLTPVAMYGVGYHAICRCTMWWDKQKNKMYIMIHHLPQTGSAEDYHLWANVGGKMVNMGIINDAIRDKFIEMPGAPDGATAFTVTLEAAGAAVTSPGSDVFLQGKI
jgi:anti-sigma-K factor RskA